MTTSPWRGIGRFSTTSKRFWKHRQDVVGDSLIFSGNTDTTVSLGGFKVAGGKTSHTNKPQGDTTNAEAANQSVALVTELWVQPS
jgi:hypothetical protein